LGKKKRRSAEIANFCLKTVWGVGGMREPEPQGTGRKTCQAFNSSNRTKSNSDGGRCYAGVKVGEMNIHHRLRKSLRGGKLEKIS